MADELVLEIEPFDETDPDDLALVEPPRACLNQNYKRVSTADLSKVTE